MPSPIFSGPLAAPPPTHAPFLVQPERDEDEPAPPQRGSAAPRRTSGDAYLGQVSERPAPALAAVPAPRAGADAATVEFDSHYFQRFVFPVLASRIPGLAGLGGEASPGAAR